MQRSLARILDANLNRAREGLRVAEDVSRFMLDDHALAGRCRDLRHRLLQCSHAWPVSQHALIAARDVKTDTETEKPRTATPRAGVSDLAGAALSRTAEALRSIEEVLRSIDAEETSAADIEQIRFSSYDIAKTLLARLPAGGARQQRLHVIITQRLCVHHAWEDVMCAALNAGAGAIQIREKEMTDRDLLIHVRSASRRIEQTSPQTELWINDRPDIAALVGATGVHLGQSDMSTHDARRILRTGQSVGRTASTVQDAINAVRDGADALGLGAMFSTTTKNNPSVVGLDLLNACEDKDILADVPHVAIGGVTPNNVADVIDAGARGIAVCSVVCGATDPGQLCADLLSAFSA